MLHDINLVGVNSNQVCMKQQVCTAGVLEAQLLSKGGGGQVYFTATLVYLLANPVHPTPPPPTPHHTHTHTHTDSFLFLKMHPFQIRLRVVYSIVNNSPGVIRV